MPARIVTLGYLGFRVLQDPAVHSAWREAAGNCARGRQFVREGPKGAKMRGSTGHGERDKVVL